MLPHGQRAIGPSGSKSWPHTLQWQQPAVSVISKRAPSRLVPSVTRSKQNRTESATTPDSAPISRRTQVILASGRRSVTASTTLSVMASSCTVCLAFGLPRRRWWEPASADAGERIAHQQVDDPGTAEGGLELHDARGVRGDVADDGRLTAERMRAQRLQGTVGGFAGRDGDE